MPLIVECQRHIVRIYDNDFSLDVVDSSDLLSSDGRVSIHIYIDNIIVNGIIVYTNKLKVIDKKGKQCRIQ